MSHSAAPDRHGHDRASPEAVTEGVTMFSRMMFPTLFVSDQDRALAFYELLGFEKRADNLGPDGRFLMVGLKGDTASLILWPGAGGKGATAPGAAPNTAAGAVFLHSDDLRRDFAELKARGVALLETEPEAYAYGLRATAVDPDGNLLSLRQVSPEWSS
jgi:catechol 2,3-dioxygenase-like lactoylglutathione lyase family enzyme